MQGAPWLGPRAGGVKARAYRARRAPAILGRMTTPLRPLLLSTALLVLASGPSPLRAEPRAAAPAARPAADAGRLAAELGRGRPVVLHFWATWCGACEGEFARLRGILNALPGRGVAVGLVNIDAPQTRARVAPALRRFGLRSLPSILLDAPDPGPVARAMHEPRWDGTLPATFVFDAAGRKVASFLGTTTEARLEEAVRAASPAPWGAGGTGRASPSGAAPRPAPPKG
ncbi:MAG: hypothetical protein NVS4B10_22610 [Myxococcales bacterium]